jgi:hypothetical protein
MACQSHTALTRDTTAGCKTKSCLSSFNIKNYTPHELASQLPQVLFRQLNPTRWKVVLVDWSNDVDLNNAFSANLTYFTKLKQLNMTHAIIVIKQMLLDLMKRKVVGYVNTVSNPIYCPS